MSGINRRAFLGVVAGCACALCPMGEALAAAAAKPFVAGGVEDFSREGVFAEFAQTHGVILVRKEGKLYAVSARCTHKNGLLQPKDGELRCPRHGARYDLSGKVIKGPAKESLVRYGISLDGQGRIRIDPTQKFAAGKWEEPGSFIRA